MGYRGITSTVCGNFERFRFCISIAFMVTTYRYKENNKATIRKLKHQDLERQLFFLRSMHSSRKFKIKFKMKNVEVKPRYPIAINQIYLRLFTGTKYAIPYIITKLRK